MHSLETSSKHRLTAILVGACIAGCGATLEVETSAAEEDPLRPAAVISVSASAAPATVSAGQEVVIRLTLSTTRTTTADVTLQLTNPDGSLGYRAGWSGQRVVAGTPLVLEETLLVEASDAPGKYLVGARALRTGSTFVFTDKSDLGSFTVSAPSASALIDERFTSSGSAFTTSGGSWAVTGGTYVLSSPTAAADPTFGISNRALHSSALTGDFDLQASLRSTDSAPWADVAVLFGVKDASNYYYAVFATQNDGFTHGLFKVAGGIQTELADFPGLLQVNTATSVRIVRKGTSLTVSRDGTAIATVQDGTFTSGKVGLGSRDNSASFDDLVVFGQAAPPPAPDTTPPTAPSGLVATATSASSVSLTWNASTDNVGVTGYVIFRGTMQIGTSNANTRSFADSGLAASTSYSYTVKATDDAGNSSPASAPASATTPAAPAQGTVTHGSQLTSSNTGVQPGITLAQSGTLTVTEAWITGSNGGRRVIENRLFPSGTGIFVRTNNVTIRNCRFLGRGGAEGRAIRATGTTGLVVEYSHFDGQHPNGTDVPTIETLGEFTVRRSHFTRWPRNFWISEHNVVIEETLMEALTGDGSGAHIENIYTAGGSNHRYVRNKMMSDCAGPSSCAISGSLAIYNESWAPFPALTNIVIENNYMSSGGGTSLYAGALAGKGNPFPTYMKVTGNIFGRDLNRYSGSWVPALAFDRNQPGNLWSANTWGARGPYWQTGDPEAGATVADPGIMY